MNKFFSLLKVSLTENFRLNKLFNKKNIIQKILFIIIAIAVLVLLGFNVGLIYYPIMLISPDPNDALGNVLSAAFSFSAIGLIIATLSQSYGFLFKGNDFDLLVSMPIPTKYIVLSKISTLLISNYLVMAITFIPAIVVISIAGLASQFIFYFNAVLIFFLFPLLIISIFTFISYFIGRLLSNFKHKNLITIIFAVVLLMGYLYYTFTLDFENSTAFINIGGLLNYIYYPANFAVSALEGSFNSLLIFVLINIVSFVIFINVMGKMYVGINTGRKRKARKNNKTLTIKKSGQTKTLIKNEFKRYFSIPQYVINTIFGKILFPFGMILIAIQFQKIEITEPLPFDINEMLYLVIGAIAIFAITLTSTTSVSISLEGRQLWILKSSPVEPKQIFISKLIVDLTTTYLPAIIGIIGIAVIIKPFNIIGLLLTTLFIIVLGLHNALLGLLINLKFPKLKWDLPVRVVKQSLSVFIHMILSFLLIFAIIIGAVFLFRVINNSNLIYLIALGFISILVLIELILLSKLGNKWFMKL